MTLVVNGGPLANQTAKPAANPAVQFRGLAKSIAGSLLKDWVGPERAGEATGRITAALAAAAASARDPSDFYACTAQSVGQCIAIAALTEIMPGTGAAALAYVVPQRPRKGEDPQLQFMFSHRGLNALARRTGQTMIAVPIGTSDEIANTDDGDVRIVAREVDDPPTTEKDLRGVVVVVREIATGRTVYRGWVPKKLIEARRAMSRAGTSDYGPWRNWYVEMAMKTAMHYAISRGWCVIDDAAAVRALSAEQVQDLPALRSETDSTPAASPALAGAVSGAMLASAQVVPAEPATVPDYAPEGSCTAPDPSSTAPTEAEMRFDDYLAELAAAESPDALLAILNRFEADKEVQARPNAKKLFSEAHIAAGKRLRPRGSQRTLAGTDEG